MNGPPTPVIIDDAALRGRIGVFENRLGAAKRLAQMLGEYRTPESVVFGIPAAGLFIAAIVAEALDLPLDAMVVSNVHPEWSKTVRHGAVGASGAPYLVEEVRQRTGVAKLATERAVETARSIAAARLARFQRRTSFAGLTGRKVLLVDDGIEDGITMQAALEALRCLNAARVVVGVATASRYGIDRIEGVDAVVCPNIRATQPFHEEDAFGCLERFTDSEFTGVLG